MQGCSATNLADLYIKNFLAGKTKLELEILQLKSQPLYAYWVSEVAL